MESKYLSNVEADCPNVQIPHVIKDVSDKETIVSGGLVDSFKLDSASANSVSSIPLPLYQCMTAVAMYGYFYVGLLVSWFVGFWVS